MIEIERFVFVCPDIEKACAEFQWKEFCISPTRQTRPFIKSRYIVFKNLMIELLQVVEHHEAKNFVFYNEWQAACKPIWVSTGCKVSCLKKAIHACKKYNIFPLESFVSNDPNYKKGFKHSSLLLSKKWNNRSLYLTEYDEIFFYQREKEICVSQENKNRFSTNIQKIKYEELTQDNNKYFNKIEDKLHLNLFKNLQTKDILLDFDWINFTITSL